MAMTVTMPQLGESVTEGTIARWLKQPGELVAKYESIAEVVTDKVNAEIPAPAEGSMGEHIAREGDVVAVGQPICTIETVEQGQANSAWHQGDEAQPAAEAAPAVEAAPATQAPAAQAAPAAQGEPDAAEAPAPAQTMEQPATAPPAQERQPEPVAATQAQPGGAAQASGGGSAAPPAQPAAPASNGQGSGNGSASGDYHLTPAVRMLVREHAVDLSQVQGTGLGGRISKKDVLDFVQRRDAGGGSRPAPQPQGTPQGQPGQQPAQAAPPQAAAAQQPGAASQPAAAPQSAAPQSAAAQSAAAPSAAPVAAAPSAAPASAGAPATPSAQAAPQLGSGDELVPLTPIRRAIADHMVRSVQTSPHAWLAMEVDMSRVSRLRSARRVEFEQRYGAKLTFLPFVARAVCESLRQYPTLNASWSDQGIILHHDIHLGIAVALEDNLIVPVIRNADRLSIAGLATTAKDLGDRARSNRLKLDEIQGGTFTLNNTGALGTTLTSPIINQPQAAILAMDSVIKRAVVVDDAIAIRPIMNLGLSFDHRLNDGLAATRFVKTVKEILESIDDNAALL
jgi:2-oxoisovalerate dehydrogenase E2 component (dihydrolipoyl transacylase)